MYNLFLEEEGFNPSRKHYVLGGCIVHTGYIKEINKKFTDLKNYIFSTPLINLKELANPNKKVVVYDKKIAHTYDDYDLLDLFKDLFEIIKKSDIQFISSIVEKNKWNELNSYPNDFYYIAYESIIKRYDNYLSEKNGYGNMIIDFNNNHLISNLEHAHNLLVNFFEEFVFINNITDSFHFNFTDNTNLSQLSYLFVKATYSLFENNKESCFDRFLQYIYNKNNNVYNYGIKIFPIEYLKQIPENITNRIYKKKLVQY